jgi:membrane-bound ClpP family serine protease
VQAPVLQFIPSILMAAILLGGIILMVVNRPHLGSSAVLGMVGCVLLLLGVVSSSLFSFSLPSLARETDVSISMVVGVWGLVSFVFDAAGTGLLIFAVLARRKPPQDATPPGMPGWQQGPGGQQGQGWQQGPGGPQQGPGGPQQPWPPNYG